MNNILRYCLYSITATILIYGGSYWFSYYLIANEWIYGPGSDMARIIYETRSISAYALSIVLMSAGLFAPLLTLLWSNAIQSMAQAIDSLQSLNSAPYAKKRILKCKIKETYKIISKLEYKANRMKPLFVSTIILIFIFIVLYIVINTFYIPTVEHYRILIVLNAAAAIIFLILLFLFLYYQIAIRKTIKDYENRVYLKDAEI